MICPPTPKTRVITGLILQPGGSAQCQRLPGGDGKGVYVALKAEL